MADFNEIKKLEEKDDKKKYQEYIDLVRPHFIGIQKVLGELDLKYFERETEADHVKMNADICKAVMDYAALNNLAPRDIEFIVARIVQSFAQGAKKIQDNFTFMKEDLLENSLGVPFNKIPVSAIDEMLKKMDNNIK